MAEPLGGEQAPVGEEAGLPECRQVPQPLADAEVPGVVDGCLGSDGLAQLLVILIFECL